MKIADNLLDLLYPRRCAFCGRFTTKEEEEFCTECREIVPWIEPGHQRISLENTAGCYSSLYYRELVRDSVIRYKFYGKNAYYRTYGKITAKCIDENEISCDIISWVPLSRKRLRRRGYNQAELFARYAAQMLGVPSVPVLEKFRNNPPQSGTADEEQRRKNVRNVYRLYKNADIADKKILLVDDIVTTGSTLSECAAVLLAGGAAEVTAVTLARTEKIN